MRTVDQLRNNFGARIVFDTNEKKTSVQFLELDVRSVTWTPHEVRFHIPDGGERVVPHEEVDKWTILSINGKSVDEEENTNPLSNPSSVANMRWEHATVFQHLVATAMSGLLYREFEFDLKDIATKAVEVAKATIIELDKAEASPPKPGRNEELAKEVG